MLVQLHEIARQWLDQSLSGSLTYVVPADASQAISWIIALIIDDLAALFFLSVGLFALAGAPQVGLFLANAAILVAAPWVSSFRTAFLGEFPVEPLPYNSNKLIHCDWNNERSTSGFGSVPRLNHGNTHSDPFAVEQICRWIDAEFGGPPKATATLSGLIVAAVAAIDGEESMSG